MPPCQKLGFIEIDLARHAAVLFAMLPSFPRIRNHFREAAGILSLFRAASGSVHESAKSETGRHDACAKRRDPCGNPGNNQRAIASSDTPLANNLFM